MVSGDEPELDAFVHDAHPVFEFDALVPVPDHALVQQRDELVDRDTLEASLVEELLLACRSPRRLRCPDCGPSRPSTASGRGSRRRGSIMHISVGTKQRQ